MVFLATRSNRTSPLRDGLLLLFLCTTFFVIPIDRFAMILSILGLAQCPPERRGLRTAYLAVFVGMHLMVLVPPVLERTAALLG